MLMQGQIKLRSVTEDDISFLEKLRSVTMREIVTNHYLWDDNAQKERVMAHFDFAQIIVQDGKDVGLWKVVRHVDFIELLQIQLLPSCQGIGIGTKLILALQSEAQRAGLPITLHVFCSNKAFGLYSRLGFQATEQREHGIRMRWIPK